MELHEGGQAVNSSMHIIIHWQVATLKVDCGRDKTELDMNIGMRAVVFCSLIDLGHGKQIMITPPGQQGSPCRGRLYIVLGPKDMRDFFLLLPLL